MLRHALPALLVLLPAPASAAEKPVPDGFRAAAYGVWTHLAADPKSDLDRKALLKAAAICRQNTGEMARGTVIMPRGKFVVRADMATKTYVAIAAAKPGKARGQVRPWALATDRGYRAIAFVSRGKGAGARRFMLDDTGVYLRCGALPKGAEAPDRTDAEGAPAQEER